MSPKRLGSHEGKSTAASLSMRSWPRSTWEMTAMFRTVPAVFGRLVGAWRSPMSTWTNAAPMCITAKRERGSATPPVPWFAEGGWGRWTRGLGRFIWGGQQRTTNRQASCMEVEELNIHGWPICETSSSSVLTERLVVGELDSNQKNGDKSARSIAGTALHLSSNGANWRPESMRKWRRPPSMRRCLQYDDTASWAEKSAQDGCPITTAVLDPSAPDWPPTVRSNRRTCQPPFDQQAWPAQANSGAKDERLIHDRQSSHSRTICDIMSRTAWQIVRACRAENEHWWIRKCRNKGRHSRRQRLNRPTWEQRPGNSSTGGQKDLCWARQQRRNAPWTRTRRGRRNQWARNTWYGRCRGQRQGRIVSTFSSHGSLNCLDDQRNDWRRNSSFSTSIHGRRAFERATRPWRRRNARNIIVACWWRRRNRSHLQAVVRCTWAHLGKVGHLQRQVKGVKERANKLSKLSHSKSKHRMTEECPKPSCKPWSDPCARPQATPH